jgi:hypothetical protein
MKKLLLLSVLVVVGFLVKAQEPLFYKGDKLINIGLGMGSYVTNLSLSGEMGVMDGVADKGTIGLGGIVGFGSSFLNTSWTSRTSFAAAARGTFHYPFIEKLDTYGGLSLGFRYTIWQYSTNYLRPMGGVFLGGRYYFSDSMSFFGEIGAGIDYLTVGLSYKF